MRKASTSFAARPIRTCRSTSGSRSTPPRSPRLGGAAASSAVGCWTSQAPRWPRMGTSQPIKARSRTAVRGRWTIEAAVEEAVPAPVITASLFGAVRKPPASQLRQQAALGHARRVRRPRRAEDSRRDPAAPAEARRAEGAGTRAAGLTHGRHGPPVRRRRSGNGGPGAGRHPGHLWRRRRPDEAAADAFVVQPAPGRAAGRQVRRHRRGPQRQRRQRLPGGFDGLHAGLRYRQGRRVLVQRAGHGRLGLGEGPAALPDRGLHRCRAVRGAEGAGCRAACCSIWPSPPGSSAQ